MKARVWIVEEKSSEGWRPRPINHDSREEAMGTILGLVRNAGCKRRSLRAMPYYRRTEQSGDPSTKGNG